jgi:hypothetical protein
MSGDSYDLIANRLPRPSGGGLPVPGVGHSCGRIEIRNGLDV